MRNENRTHRLPISWSTPQANLPRFLSYSCPSLSLATGDEWQRTLGTRLHSRRIDLIHDIRHLYTRLKTDALKAMSRGFSGCSQAEKNLPIQEIASILFIPGNKQWKTSPPKYMANYGWKSSLLLFYDAVATVDVLTASENDEKLVETQETRTVHFAWPKSSSRFERINNFDRDYSYWQISF